MFICPWYMTIEVLIETLVFQFLYGLLAQQYHETSLKIHIQKLLKRSPSSFNVIIKHA